MSKFNLESTIITKETITIPEFVVTEKMIKTAKDSYLKVQEEILEEMIKFASSNF